MFSYIKGLLIYRGARYYLRAIKERLRTFFWNSKTFAFLYPDKEKLDKLKNKHKDQPCVLIGGGPSINKMDFSKFKNMVTIGCNSFYLKHEEIGYEPTYYTVEDPLPAKDNSIEIMSLKDTIKIIPYDLKGVIKPDENTIHVNFLRSYMRPSNVNFPLFSNEFNNKSYWGGTVMYFNIQLAKYLGCNPIYLIGVDLSYNVPSTVKKNGAVLESTEDDENHFDPRYFGKGKKWHLPETERMQSSFTKAYLELRVQGVELVNAGLNSKLKTIPKKSIK
jgi:hypothetical protein